MTYQEQRTTLRRLLISNRMLLALEAMEFAERFHTGRRLDGSHEFSHQIEMAELLLEIAVLPDRDETLAVCFLHDVREDYGVRDDVLRVRFGSRVADAVHCLTKTLSPGEIDPFRKISSNAIASVVKAADRIHNLGTMEGAFSFTKQQRYHAETQDQIRPMLITARARHTSRQHALTYLLRGLDRLSPPLDLRIGA